MTEWNSTWPQRSPRLSVPLPTGHLASICWSCQFYPLNTCHAHYHIMSMSISQIAAKSFLGGAHSGHRWSVLFQRAETVICAEAIMLHLSPLWATQLRNLSRCPYTVREGQAPGYFSRLTWYWCLVSLSGQQQHRLFSVSWAHPASSD